MIQAHRLFGGPLITPESDPSVGENINGPSLIRVPEWLPNPLGRYYLYFAHHQGRFIRLAYADDLAGPWQIYSPGTLQLDQTPCVRHIASPDVHVDHKARRIRMYYHGPMPQQRVVGEERKTAPITGTQRSLVALSQDGIHFESRDEIFGPSYFRVWQWGDYHYALGMPGYFYRSRDGLTGFKAGPVLFDDSMRHTAVLCREGKLFVFYSNAGDNPEHILCSTIELAGDWRDWQPSAPVSVLLPETEYEGGHLPRLPSQRGAVHEPVCQLRDPAVFVEGDRVTLLYAIAGERGIGAAQLEIS